MKRPFAVIGFSMLIGSLLITKLSFKMAVALIIGAIVIFAVFISFKKLREYKAVIFSLVAVAIYTISFVFAQYGYYNARAELQNGKDITGTVCQTPTMTDYAFTYIIKCDDENYKVRFVSGNDKFLSEGDRVRFKTENSENSFNEDVFEYSLSSKIYFTVFEGESMSLEKFNGKDWYYENIGKIKTFFSSVIEEYLPTEAGNIAKAMTIGERSRLDDKTVDYFNYSGTSHLLVISGLHVTMWSLGVFRILERFIKSKKILVAVSLSTLLIYSAITGFGVSVIRASLLVGLVIISKLFKRDADSINSVGLAVTIILISNPFAVLSVSLWLTVLSTLGILVFSQDIYSWIEDFCIKRHIPHKGLMDVIILSLSISISTSICTLPVFIVKLRMLPIGSLFANIIMVDLAMLLMVLTVVGVALHSVGFVFFTRPIFIIVGVLADFLTSVAKKIGMAEWSTISVSHKYFEYFLIIAINGVIAIFVAKKFNKNIVKQIAVALCVLFVLITCYTTAYDYNNPCIEIVFTESKPVILVKSGDTSFLVGTNKKEYLPYIKAIEESHNEKQLDGIVVTDYGNDMVSNLLAVYDCFGITQTYFSENAPKIFESHSKGNVKEITIGGKLNLNFQNSENVIEITSKNKRLVFIDCEKENDFENIENYDIIVMYGKHALERAKTVTMERPELESKIAVPQQNKQMTIYIE